MGSNQSSTYSPFTRRHRPPLTEEQRQERLANRYEYLKQTFSYYLLHTSTNWNTCSHGYVINNHYDYKGILSACRNDVKMFTTIYDLFALLLYVPPHWKYSDSLVDYLNTSEVRYKQNMIKVRNNKYSTHDLIAWNNHHWNIFFRNPIQEQYFKIPFRTAFALLDILNLEYHLFTNDEWICRNFSTFMPEFRSMLIPKRLRNLFVSWISEYEKEWLLCRQASKKWITQDVLHTRLMFAIALKKLFVVTEEEEKDET